jgi:hypothetical protein
LEHGIFGPSGDKTQRHPGIKPFDPQSMLATHSGIGVLGPLGQSWDGTLKSLIDPLNKTMLVKSPKLMPINQKIIERSIANVEEKLKREGSNTVLVNDS